MSIDGLGMRLSYNHPDAVGPFLKGLNLKNDLAGLIALTEAFLRFPYENFTKIIHAKDINDKAGYLRMPDIIWDEHKNFGAGGTCFSLTYFFESVLKEVGFDCYSVMVDRSYGKDTHCAMIVKLEGQKYLVDPGFCLSRPLPLTDKEMEHRLPHNTYIVTPACHPRGSNRGSHACNCIQGIPAYTRGDDNVHYTISTKQLGQTKSRYLLKDSPISPAEFLKFWEDSFSWPMMRHLCATRLSDDGFLYLRDSFVRLTAHENKKQENIKADYELRVGRLFGIAPEVVRQAAEILY